MIRINWDKIEKLFLEAKEIAKKWDKERTFWEDLFTWYADRREYYFDMWPFNSSVLNTRIFPIAKRNREDFIKDENNIKYLNEIVLCATRYIGLQLEHLGNLIGIDSFEKCLHEKKKKGMGNEIRFLTTHHR